MKREREENDQENENPLPKKRKLTALIEKGLQVAKSIGFMNGLRLGFSGGVLAFHFVQYMSGFKAMQDIVVALGDNKNHFYCLLRCMLLSETFQARCKLELDGDTVLQVAVGLMHGAKLAEEDFIDIIKRALDAGMNIDEADYSGCTPLCLAAGLGNITIMRLLVNKFGANVHVVDDNFSEAGKMMNAFSFNFIKNRKAPLHLAALFAGSDAIRVLVTELGADVNAVTEMMGVTPLHRAAAIGNIEGMRTLIELGANFNAVDKRGETPLSLAICEDEQPNLEERRSLYCTKQVLLIESGADFSALDPEQKETDIDAIRDAVIKRYKYLLSEGPVESLKNKALAALFFHLGGKEYYKVKNEDKRLSDVLPDELLVLYRSTPQREQRKGNYFNILAFCQENLHLTREEKEKYGFQV